jgi:c-di-GMP-binding flagellar brake protein YcgR
MSEAKETGHTPATSPRASLKEVQRRRSERILLTVPIRVEGMDRNGEKFSEETHTIMIGREGARISLKHAVAPGATVQITTRLGHHSARFRIVGPTHPPSTEEAEWGVECLRANCDLWGIRFPAPSSAEGICTALIECRRCHAVVLSPLTLVEHEVLGTSGLLVKPCEDCGRATAWSYRDLEIAPPGDESAAAAPRAGNSLEHRAGPSRRLHRRVALQLPIRVRSFYGTEEFTRTENVSRGGMCFISGHKYEVGEVILVTCPFEEGGQNIEVRGQVVRRQEMAGGARRIYGVSYER